MLKISNNFKQLVESFMHRCEHPEFDSFEDGVSRDAAERVLKDMLETEKLALLVEGYRLASKDYDREFFIEQMDNLLDNRRVCCGRTK